MLFKKLFFLKLGGKFVYLFAESDLLGVTPVHLTLLLIEKLSFEFLFPNLLLLELSPYSLLFHILLFLGLSLRFEGFLFVVLDKLLEFSLGLLDSLVKNRISNLCGWLSDFSHPFLGLKNVLSQNLIHSLIILSSSDCGLLLELLLNKGMELSLLLWWKALSVLQNLDELLFSQVFSSNHSTLGLIWHFLTSSIFLLLSLIKVFYLFISLFLVLLASLLSNFFFSLLFALSSMLELSETVSKLLLFRGVALVVDFSAFSFFLLLRYFLDLLISTLPLLLLLQLLLLG